MGDNNTAKDTPAAVGKSEEPSRDGSASSIATTPEPEAESYSAQEQPQQQQKRKGGRKPVSSPPLAAHTSHPALCLAHRC